MASKPDVKLRPLEVRVPSIELLVKKYGRHLIPKHSPPRNSSPSGSVVDYSRVRQARCLQMSTAKAVQKSSRSRSIVSPDVAELSDSDSTSSRNGMRREPKLVIGYKLLQNKKSKTSHYSVRGRQGDQNTKNQAQTSVSQQNKKIIVESAKTSTKKLMKNTVSEDNLVTDFNEAKSRSQSKEKDEVTESAFAKSLRGVDELRDEVHRKLSAAHVPHPSTSKSLHQSELKRSKECPKDASALKMMSMGSEAKHDANTKSSVTCISDKINKTVPAENHDGKAQEKSKLSGGLLNSFSLKLKKLKIELHRIDDHPLLNVKAQAKGGKSQQANTGKGLPKKEKSKDQSLVVEINPTPPAVPTVALKTPTPKSLPSPVFEEKLAGVTLILSQSCKCDCGLDYPTQELLLRHSVEVHSGNNPGKGRVFNFKCQFCDIRFERWTSRKKHELKSHISKPALSSDSASALISDFTIAPSIDSVPAPSGDSVSAPNSDSTPELTRHSTPAPSSDSALPGASSGRQAKTISKITCELCGEVFVNRSNFSFHRAVAHNSQKVISCRVCDEIFKSDELLQIHNNNVHNFEQNEQKTQGTIQKCSKCDKCFKTVLQLNLHDREKHSGAAHTCDCGAPFSTKAQLNRHIKQEHSLIPKQVCQKTSGENQRKRPGPKRKTEVKRRRFCTAKPYRSGTNFNHSVKRAEADFQSTNTKEECYANNVVIGELVIHDENPLQVKSEHVVVECDSYLEDESINFNDFNDDYTDEPLQDPLADPFLVQEAAVLEDSQALAKPSPLNSNELQPSLLALLEGTDPSDPDYYMKEGEETVTLNYMPPEPEYIKCPHCPKTFIDQIQLKQHSQIHAARIRKPYRCLFPDCCERFDSSANLARHRLEAHTRNSRKPVPAQVQETSQSQELQADEPFTSVPEEQVDGGESQEQEVKPESEGFTCKVCGDKFDKVAAFVKHEWSHAGDLTCTYCPSRFENIVSYNKHVAGHERKKRTLLPLPQNAKASPILTPIITSTISLRDKKAESTAHGQKFRCHYCKSTFKAMKYYTNHMTAHLDANPNGKFKYKCQYCRKKFNDRKRFAVHIRNHSKLTSIRCRVCPKSFKSMVELTEHKKVHVNIYGCSYCNKKFDRKSAFESHLVMHSKEKLFSCKFCLETFYRKHTLLIHIRRHHKTGQTNSKSHDEPVAPGSMQQMQLVEFEQRYEMAKSELDSLNEQFLETSKTILTPGKFPCRYCAEKFDKKVELTLHQEGHKIHRCSLCPKKFLDMSHLSMHVKKIHSGNVVFRCEPCDKSFAKLCNLRKHYTTKNHLAKLEEYNSRQDKICWSYGENSFEPEHNTTTVLFPDEECISRDSEKPEALSTLPLRTSAVNASSSIVKSSQTAAPSFSPMLPDSNVWVALEVTSGATMTRADSSAVPNRERIWSISGAEIIDPSQSHALYEAGHAVNYACPQCSNVFDSSDDLNTHIRSIHEAHSDDRVVSLCRPCNRFFMSLQDFTEHTSTVHARSADTTPLAQETASSWKGPSPTSCETTMKATIAHKDNEAYDDLRNCTLGMTCWTCGSMLPGIINLSGHMKEHHGTYTCPYDGSTFAEESELLTHFRLHTTKNPCRCKFCKPAVRISSDDPPLVQSDSVPPDAGVRVTPDTNEDEEDEVEIIETNSSSENNDDDDITILEEHINNPGEANKGPVGPKKKRCSDASSSAQKPAVPILTQCVTCRLNFTSKASYETHLCVSDQALSKAALDDRNNQFKCSMCPRTFAQLNSLTEHVNLHKHLRGLVSKLNWGETKQVASNSDHSSKKMPQAPAPTKSVAKQAESRKLVRAVDRTFASKDNSKQQSSTTTAKPSLHCEKCYKKFKTSFELGSHLAKKNHRAEHICPLCRLCYSYKEFLLHLRFKHPGETIYSCSNICQIHFRTPGALDRHLNSTQHSSRLRMHELFIAQQLKLGNTVLDYECPQCKAGFSSEVLVVDHIFNSEAYSNISNPPCRPLSTNSESGSANAGAETGALGTKSHCRSSLSSATQDDSHTTKINSDIQVVMDRPRGATTSILPESGLISASSNEDMEICEPEEEQETDVIFWSSAEEDELDETPVFQIVNHAPL